MRFGEHPEIIFPGLWQLDSPGVTAAAGVNRCATAFELRGQQARRRVASVDARQFQDVPAVVVKGRCPGRANQPFRPAIGNFRQPVGLAKHTQIVAADFSRTQKSHNASAGVRTFKVPGGQADQFVAVEHREQVEFDVPPALRPEPAGSVATRWPATRSCETARRWPIGSNRRPAA